MIDENKYNSSERILVIAGSSDEIVFKKWKSFPIPKLLVDDPCKQSVVLILRHRNVMLTADTTEIRTMKTIKHPTAVGGISYHLPILKWNYLDGDCDWKEKLFIDFGWQLNK